MATMNPDYYFLDRVPLETLITIRCRGDDDAMYEFMDTAVDIIELDETWDSDVLDH